MDFTYEQREVLELVIPEPTRRSDRSRQTLAEPEGCPRTFPSVIERVLRLPSLMIISRKSHRVVT
jgi:hypothetical protein